MRRFQHSQVSAAVNSKKKRAERVEFDSHDEHRSFLICFLCILFLYEKDLHFGLLMTSRLRPEPINGFISELPKLSMLSTWRWCRASLLVEFYNNHLTRRWERNVYAFTSAFGTQQVHFEPLPASTLFMSFPATWSNISNVLLITRATKRLVVFP